MLFILLLIKKIFVTKKEMFFAILGFALAYYLCRIRIKDRGTYVVIYNKIGFELYVPSLYLPDSSVSSSVPIIIERDTDGMNIIGLPERPSSLGMSHLEVIIGKEKLLFGGNDRIDLSRFYNKGAGDQE